MTPLDQALTALKDIEHDLAGEMKFMQSSDGRFATPHAIAHINTARLMLTRVRQSEEATSERLFDQEQDISDYEMDEDGRLTDGLG